MTTIYVAGHGYMDMDAYRVHKVVNEYDERLSFKRHPESGDWCAFMKMPHNEPDYPVIGFGSECPHADYVIQKIRENDTVRWGEKWYKKKVYEHNLNLYAALDQKADDAASDTAERMEVVLRKEGMSPIVKSLRPKSRG